MIQSSDGLVLLGTLKGLYRYDGYRVSQVNMPNGLPFNSVRALAEDGNGVIWIGTKEDGVFYIKSGLVFQLGGLEHIDYSSFQVMAQSEAHVYLIFDHVVIQVDQELQTTAFNNPIKETIFSAIVLGQDQLTAGLKDSVVSLNLGTSAVSSVAVRSDVPNRQKHLVHRDPQGRVWLGRSDGLYQYDPECHCFKGRDDVLHGVEIHTLGSDSKNLWIGTNQMGVYGFDSVSGKTTHFNFDSSNPKGINDKAVISVATSPLNDLYLGTFNGGLNHINLDTLKFGAVPGVGSGVNCLPSEVIYGMYELNTDELLVGTNQGFTLLNTTLKTCVDFYSQSNDSSLNTGQYVFSFFPRGDQVLLMGLTGIHLLDTSSKSIRRWSELIPNVPVFFLYELDDDSYLFGTDQGLYAFNETEQKLVKYMSEDGDEISLRFYHAAVTSGGTYVSGTGGLFKLAGNRLQQVTIQLENGHFVRDITGLSTDGNDGLLVAADKQYLLQFRPGEDVRDFSHLVNEKTFNVTVFEIIQDDFGRFWMSSDNGLYQLDLEDQRVHRYTESDGLQSNDFLLISSHKGASGKLYFGGRHGLNAFNPEDISINETPPKVVLTEVSQLNKTIGLGQQTMGGFLLEQPIEQLDFLELSHNDLDIGFEFAALDYAAPARNQFAYRLLGFNDDWQYVGADNRRANFTNLSPGNYTFEVKAANKDGVWNPEPRQLAITVYPAPWFSPWAYAAYGLIILLSIWGFVHYKTIASRNRARELQTQVAERTQEVVRQKQMVESLLDHKNEVFANVTHEFKTPLSLIVGPLDQLADLPVLDQHQDKVSMIKRNAQRLLLMVGQILKLSEAEQDKEVIREVQAVQPVCLMLFESFTPLAREKGIDLRLNNEHDVNVYATSECLEMVIGNLLSNAIKYTPQGGRVLISTEINKGHVSISVSDTGPGVSDQDKGRIFNRFVRLDGHQGVQGTGIGLAVVKEVTVANKGHAQVLDPVDGGAEFVVTFPVTDQQVDGGLTEAMTEQLVRNTGTEINQHVVVEQPDAQDDEQRPTVLIIEDNPDMQQHTLQVLQGGYQCLLASRGDEGIGLALKEIPDIIICDVMMPGMDGYQVTRVLRNDSKTSHIPIILLTALNTRESRIKGWRANIDRYVTKPFDAHELHAQLQNILSVRQLLQNQTAQIIENKGDLEHLDLTKQDIRFLDQLKAVIVEVFGNEYIQKADLASRMAISERQLQRKVKALIGVGPLDLLRDHRLEHGREKLREGLQVSQVSDLCGFSSVSYFGTCFKKKFGMTPKQYQQLGRSGASG
ncbi:response regulator [Marinicella sediminis]|uniref:histidine kinase n=1 Tax=Marinicella sediminis TaxID=1792834 RepID=A0ABV7J6V5_9GAMM|nr:response regulator [Marinicella sediminis]